MTVYGNAVGRPLEIQDDNAQHLLSAGLSRLDGGDTTAYTEDQVSGM